MCLKRICFLLLLGGGFYRLSSWLIVLFKTSIFLLIFCLLSISIIERKVLKSSSVIMDLSILSFSSNTSCFMCFVRWIHIKDYCISSVNWVFYHRLIPSSYLLIFFVLKFTLSNTNMSTFSFLWFVFAWYIFFSFFYFKLFWIIIFKTGFLYTA